jgi:hypothetical protein
MKSDKTCLLICLKVNTLLNLFHPMPAMLYSEAFTSLFLLHFDQQSCFYVQDKYTGLYNTRQLVLEYTAASS